MKKDFKLSELPKHNIYQVPEGYFDTLPMRVMERTAGAAQQRRSWIPVRSMVRLALAPLLLLLILGSVFFLNSAKEQLPASAEFAALHRTDIITYLSSSQETIESNDFAQLSALEDHDLAADFLNVSPEVAEEELEYHNLNHIEY